MDYEDDYLSKKKQKEGKRKEERKSVRRAEETCLFHLENQQTVDCEQGGTSRGMHLTMTMRGGGAGKGMGFSLRSNDPWIHREEESLLEVM